MDGDSQATLAPRVWDTERLGTEGAREALCNGRSSTMIGLGRLSSTIRGGTIGELGAVET